MENKLLQIIIDADQLSLIFGIITTISFVFSVFSFWQLQKKKLQENVSYKEKYIKLTSLSNSLDSILNSLMMITTLSTRPEVTKNELRHHSYLSTEVAKKTLDLLNEEKISLKDKFKELIDDYTELNNREEEA